MGFEAKELLQGIRGSMTVFLAHGIYDIRSVIPTFRKTTNGELFEHHVLLFLAAIPLDFSLSLLSKNDTCVNMIRSTLRAIVA